MGVSVSTTATSINVTVDDQSISASVGGGIGPQGPASTAAAGVSSLNGLTGTLTVQAGANITVTTGTAGLTIAGASGGASTWDDISGKPNLVYSVAGRTGTVTLTTADIGGYQAPAVTSVAGRTGAVTISTTDVSGYTAPPVSSVAGRTGVVTLTTADLSGNLVATVNGISGTLSIVSGANVTVTTAASSITIAAASGGGSVSADTVFHPFLLGGM